MREATGTALRWLFTKLGVSPKRVDEYIDYALAIPTTLALIVSLKPLFSWADGSGVGGGDLWSALFWHLIAVLLSSLSPNWNFVLGMAWGFMGLRGIVAMVRSNGDPRVVLLTVVFLSLWIAFTYLKVALACVGSKRLKDKRQ